MIVVAADSPYKTLKALVEAHKADPSGFAVAGGGAVGSQDWMKGSLIAKAAGQDPKTMRYVALEGGHVKVGSGDAAEMVKHHHVARKVRILAVMAPEFTKERDARGLFEFTLIGSAFDARVTQDVKRFKVLAKEAGM